MLNFDRQVKIFLICRALTFRILHLFYIFWMMKWLLKSMWKKADFTNKFSLRIQMNRKFLMQTNSNKVIATKFCTWHNSCTVQVFTQTSVTRPQWVNNLCCFKDILFRWNNAQCKELTFEIMELKWKAKSLEIIFIVMTVWYTFWKEQN